jgi:tetratricopeptide (TPR) repeat protein
MKSFLSLTLFITGIWLIVSCSGPSDKLQDKQADASIEQDNSELELLNQKILNNSNDDKLFIERAEYFLAHQQADSALRDIFFAIDINNDEPAHFVLLSDAYLVLGNPDKCKESLDKALAIDASNKETRLKLAMLYLYMREYDESARVATQLIKDDNINPEAYFVRGYGQMEKGDTAAAISDFKAAADQDQEYYDAYLQLGIIFSAKHHPLAVEYLNSAIKIRPNTIQPYYQLALFFQENEQIEKAITTYQAIIGIEPDFVFAYYNLGYINLVYIKDFDKAIEYFTKVVEIDPGYAEAWYNRGWSYELAGNAGLARKDYEKTLEIKTNFQLAVDGLNRLDNQ